MSVNISPIPARRMSVGAADDPYKKYWWVILGGFVLTGAWLCLPGMETPVGSIHVDTRAKAVDVSGSDQSLDGADNPAGAPGGALDLSMDGAKHKSKSGDEDMTSMLFQAAPETGAGTAAAAGKPLGDATAASASASLAQQLKDAGKKADASGWNEKAQRGFTAPHLAGASLSGSGSASGGSSASAGGGAGAFGTRNANVGFGTTQGLKDDGSAESAGFKALKASAGNAAAPNLKGSAEAMHASMSQAFDGAKGKAPGAGMGAMSQAQAAYDAAPANLKANDPKFDSKKLPDPPSAPMPPSTGQDMGKQLAMMVGMALVGGMVGGMAGQMVMMVGTQMMQMQQQQAAADAAAKATAAQQNKPGWKPS